MASSLSDLINNLSERIHKIKGKYDHNDKKSENCGIKYKYCDCLLKYTNFKDDLMEYKCNNFLIYRTFLTLITVSLFYYFEKLLIFMNIWMI